MKYYVYGLKCPLEQTIKYVGASINPKQRFSQHLTDGIGKLKTEWILSLKNQKEKPELVIFKECKSSEEASVCEIEYCNIYSDTVLNSNISNNKYHHTNNKTVVSVSYRIEEKYLKLKAIAEKEERSQTAIFQIMIRERAEKLGVKTEKKN